jgi:hypothetical protein
MLHGEGVTVQAAQSHSIEINYLNLTHSRPGQHVNYMRSNSTDTKNYDRGFLEFSELFLTKELNDPCQLLVLDLLVVFTGVFLLLQLFNGLLFFGSGFFGHVVRDDFGGDRSDQNTTKEKAELCFAQHQQKGSLIINSK